MNRRGFVIGAITLGAAVFAGGTWYNKKRQADEAEARLAAVPDLNEILLRPGAPFLGPKDAAVTLVEFFDPSCEACRAFHPVLEALRKEFPTELRIVLRYTPFHQGSAEAVAILESARRQGKFEQVLNALFERQPEWGSDSAPNIDFAWQIAGSVGMDISTRASEPQNPGTVAILRQDLEDIEALGVRATPTFFFEGKQLQQVSFESLQATVRDAVARSK
ncbi:DsbA family protein [Pseudogemmobacter bohemicus]|uniref:DsbA family protein n=1 Tax=Pseudogemmobacter bohemicus TaxID=2250708 RepID=UPI000DD4B763|nr:thioredoxin domain-containing protein [Pseudogemmobacter bohemicus]